jgi:D-amino-acid dehydrogenase
VSAKTVVVVGAGICGVSTAIYLNRMGYKVSLIDKGKPGMGASYGNSGLLAQWAVDPVASPDLWRIGPKYLANKNSALFIKWGYMPRMFPWLIRFLSNATDKGARHVVRSLGPLLSDAVDQHKSLVQNTPLDGWVRDSKISFVYRDKMHFDSDTYSWKMKKTAGLIPKVVTGEAVREEEPILGKDYRYLAVLEGQGHITDPGQYVAKLADHFTSLGGRVISAEVHDLQKNTDGRISGISTDIGTMPCDFAVITAGIWSKGLTKKLGLKIPLEAERGYHVIFENPSVLPRNPLLMVDGKFGVNSMDMGLRCAGTVELGDHKSGPSVAPIKLIKNHARQAFPKLTFSGTQEWMGFRPSTPDSLPVIGEVENSGIFVGFGHQHVGLTAGPKTGYLLSQMVAGQNPNMDLLAFNPSRFSL